MRIPLLAGLAGLTLFASLAAAQTHVRPRPSAERLPPQRAGTQAQAQAQPPQQASVPRSNMVVATVTLADIGYTNGVRFANMGGRREIFIPVPQSDAVVPKELTLVLDDVTAHEARRSLEVLVNERSAASIALDGKGMARVIRVPLANVKPRDGFVKLSFVYNGAATQNRCIDVRFVGDSVTVRPESGLDLEFDPAMLNDVATIAALMPREVTVLLPSRRLAAPDFAAAMAAARSLANTGRHAQFHVGYERPPETVDADGRKHWTRGLVVIGTPEEVTGAVPPPFANRAGIDPNAGAINAIRVGGYPALLISEGAGVRASRLLGARLMGATRGMSSATVAALGPPKINGDRITFDQLGLAPAPVEVFGRAEIGVSVDSRRLPPDTRIARLLLDIMVAPDGTGEKAVVSVFVNDRLLANAVAERDGPTHVDIALPDGFIETAANIRAVVLRRSAQGDCRFEPQGYPAQILGSSAVILTSVGPVHDFGDLTARWANGIEVVAPSAAADRPDKYLGLMSDIVSDLSPELSPINVRFADNDTAAAPAAPFLVVGTQPPSGSDPHVRFDRGRVVVNDRSGRTLLDLAGFTSGAVAQLVTSDGKPGIWLHPLASDGGLPAPALLRIGRGDVAFVDQNGVALAMSTERDTLLHIEYPDQTNWTTLANRFRSWIIGALWLLATVAFLYALQRMRRQRPPRPREE
ncbi:MAG TPA: cellulose biosynthesis cyclic di-GMP-binding regulatory protein BcsB [Pseudolabrys sp.]|nr:cellulose biosynthesis cyclic di-GMP-binding regulatory protein BcsB [Pseudolabrys sp.]